MWNLQPFQEAHTVTLKSTGLTLCKYLLPMQDFIMSCIGHLENTGSMSYADLPNVDTFHCITSKKSHLFLMLSWKKF